MATVAHIIRSHYDPADREHLERETGQRPIDDDSDPWQTESSFSASHRTRAAPTFVPASFTHDEWGVPTPPRGETRPDPSTSTAAWYRALTAAASPVRTDPDTPPPPTRAANARTHASRPLSTPSPAPAPAPATRARRPDWFAHPARAPAPSSPARDTLADILARDPPPHPSAGGARFVPPVWLHIGPSNRGFGMLARRGWREGEGLGAHVVRSAGAVEDGDGDGDGRGAPAIIDLTLSDSDSEQDVDVDVGQAQEGTGQSGAGALEADGSGAHMQRSLLTPLPTVLKADRLGIGLKAKTEGPYRQSKKRVTHSAAALAAHIQAAEEMRRHKAIVGRGRRGFAKTHKKEEERRKAMLAYLNE